MALRHSIVGNEALRYSPKRLSPALGAMSSFGAPRRRSLPKWLAPSFIGSGLLLLMAIGKTVSPGGI